jgi:DMSO/TMAO reductase YedYZ molybdopterin-dependent catalytic subunit
VADTAPVAFGGLLRLRVPRQLRYKRVKFVNRLAVTDSLKRSARAWALRLRKAATPGTRALKRTALGGFTTEKMA